ncbi:hypothetical protein [Pseudomonas sp. CCOS 191]|uniref:hypothetical protein n=1 Tax=Pseudomonas sp. CCOS 191 TaxID=1649877 RepID=UPI0018E6DBDA|nr:hypothetical protein [Pseudomonas sp. CCOS 191]MBI6954012.1 hypothetical protein [Pseudomonas sp. CCOS 191]
MMTLKGTILERATHKIEERISMTNQVTIMTTDVVQSTVLNIFKDNDVYHYSGLGLSLEVPVAAASYVVQDERVVGLSCAFDYVCSMLSERFPEHDFWLCLATSCVQPDTRVVRYRGLWGSVKHRALQVADGQDVKESMMVTEEGVTFIGALRFPTSSLKSVVRLMEAESNSYVFFLPKGVGFDDCQISTFHGSVEADLGSFSPIFVKGGAVLVRVGFFDDVARGVLLLASPDFVKTL